MDGRILVQGPVYDLEYLQWLQDDDREVRVIVASGPAGAHIARAGFRNPLAIGHDELCGFDPLTDERRFLRAAQNYSCVPIERGTLPDDIRGAIVVPDGLRVARCERALRISVDPHEAVNRQFLEDAISAPADERLVWRYEGAANGFLIVPASTVATHGVGNVDCIVVGETDALDKIDQGADIYGFLRVDDATTRKVVRVERRIGRIVCAAV